MIEHIQAVWDELTAAGSRFAMTEIEVRGVPMRVFASAPPTMRAVWEIASGYGDRTYVVYEDERYTYTEIDARVRALAHHLRDEHGIGVGDRVAIAMRNYPEWVVSYWAIASLGAAAVGMNAWWTPAEMAYGPIDAGPKVLIADDERLERVVEVIDEVRGHSPLHVISTRSDRDLATDSSRWDDVIDPANPPDGLPAKPASCGRVVPNVEARLESYDGAVLDPGPDAVGERCVRGPIVVKGYLNKPEATADAIRDGWFRTGDIARIDDDGYVYIVDCAKDMVNRGGENVYCSEVESAIFEHRRRRGCRVRCPR